MSERSFPILKPAPGRAKTVPWAWIEQYARRAQQNHYQSLERLAERGGLSPAEMWLLIADTNRLPKDVPDSRYQDIVDRTIADWRATGERDQQVRAMHKLTAIGGLNMTWERACHVYLNGVEVKGVTRADEAAGEINRCVDDGRGGWLVSGSKLVTQTLRGNVEIKLKADADKAAQSMYWLARLGNPHLTEAGWL